MRGLVPVAAAALLSCSACRTAQTPVERALAEHSGELRSATVNGGEVRLRCSQPDAEVLLDGVPVGRCDDFDGEPTGLLLDEGGHGLEVRKSGFAPWRAAVQAGGTRTVLKVELTPLQREKGSEGP